MKHFLYAVAFLFFLSFFGCKPKETTLSGQVFIVTRGAENIKLGLVEVQLIQKQSAVDCLKEKQSAIDTEMKSRKDEYEKAKTDYQKDHDDFELFKATNHVAELANRYEFITGEIDAYDRENLAQANKIEALSNDFQEAKRVYETSSGSLRVYYREIATQKGNAGGDFARARIKWLDANSSANQANIEERTRLAVELQKFLIPGNNVLDKKRQFESCALKLEEASHPTSDDYFKKFSPAMIQRATTDADGRFSFSYPRNKPFTLFAKAERLVGDEKETYYWLVNAPSEVEKAQLFLSNQNLVTVDPDGYFKTKPKCGIVSAIPKN